MTTLEQKLRAHLDSLVEKKVIGGYTIDFPFFCTRAVRPIDYILPPQEDPAKPKGKKKK